MRISDANEVHVTWIYEGECFVYRSVPKSVVSNVGKKSLRCELAEVNDYDENFEVLIREKAGSYVFRADFYSEADEELPLKAFKATDGIILYFEDSYGYAYFRVGM